MELTPQEKAKDKRLWKAYRWTIARYYALERFQNHKCAGCGREVKNAPLNVDHEHFKIAYSRFTSESTNEKKWLALVQFNDGRTVTATGRNKTEAKEAVKDVALPISVRGLLCPGRYMGCNRLLGRIDNTVWLESMLRYLKDPPALKMEKECQPQPHP